MNGTKITFAIKDDPTQTFTGYDTGDRRSWGVSPYVDEQTLLSLIPFCEDVKYNSSKRVLSGSGFTTKEVAVFVNKELRLLFSTFLLDIDLISVDDVTKF